MAALPVTTIQQAAQHRAAMAVEDPVAMLLNLIHPMRRSSLSSAASSPRALEGVPAAAARCSSQNIVSEDLSSLPPEEPEWLHMVAARTRAAPAAARRRGSIGSCGGARPSSSRPGGRRTSAYLAGAALHRCSTGAAAPSPLRHPAGVLDTGAGGDHNGSGSAAGAHLHGSARSGLPHHLHTYNPSNLGSPGIYQLQLQLSRTQRGSNGGAPHHHRPGGRPGVFMLLDRFGSCEGLSAAVDDFYRRLCHDPRVSAAVKRVPDHAVRYAMVELMAHTLDEGFKPCAHDRTAWLAQCTSLLRATLAATPPVGGAAARGAAAAGSGCGAVAGAAGPSPSALGSFAAVQDGGAAAAAAAAGSGSDDLVIQVAISEPSAGDGGEVPVVMDLDDECYDVMMQHMAATLAELGVRACDGGPCMAAAGGAEA